MALASLTATYTDSEGEDEDQDRSVEDNIASGNTTPDKTPVTSATNSPVPVKVTSKVLHTVTKEFGISRAIKLLGCHV